MAAPGHAVELETGIRVILAPNPSPMTYTGTNTYLIGTDPVVVVDPGPISPEHLQAILSATAGAKVASILITHSHLDHSPLATALRAQTGAPVLAYGHGQTGQGHTMAALAASGQIGGGEGVDDGFVPDQMVSDQEWIDIGPFAIQALWTPGHMSNHMSFAIADAIFTGDHVMGWASSLISPPDGDLTAFMRSCRMLADRRDRVYYAGHGDPVTDPKGRLDWLIAHRQSRESQILQALVRGPATAAQITQIVYTDAPRALLRAAERNALAHLIDMTERGLASYNPPLTRTSIFTRIDGA